MLNQAARELERVVRGAGLLLLNGGALSAMSSSMSESEESNSGVVRVKAVFDGGCIDELAAAELEAIDAVEEEEAADSGWVLGRLEGEGDGGTVLDSGWRLQGEKKRGMIRFWGNRGFKTTHTVSEGRC